MRRLAFLLVGLLAVAAQAQDFPTRPIRMIVPYAPGGLPDTMTRIIGPKLSEALGQQIVVENRPGAGGISGTEIVARSSADGYTLLIADVGQLAINPHLFKQLPYDPLQDLAPGSLTGSTAPLLLLQAALAAGAGRADQRRARRARVQLRAGDRAARAGRHAARDRRAPFRRSGQGGEDAGGGAALPAARHRPGRQHARGLQRADPERLRA